MIILVLVLLLRCDQSQQNLTFELLATTGKLKAFSISLASMRAFKGLPRLPILNQTAGETRSVYYYDQLIAILDIAEGKKLLHCELIEIYESNEKYEVFKNLSTSNAHRISFKDMLKLMDKCDKLDENLVRSLNFNVEQYNEGNLLFDGIVPGTKWCGTGDIAKSYHDLGSRARIDRCCRTHDLCPIKIRAYKSRYNLTNNSFFSKSHCSCDKTFYNCLKNINHVSARIIGNIYFNIAQPVCIEDVLLSRDKERRFVPIKIIF